LQNLIAAVTCGFGNGGNRVTNAPRADGAALLVEYGHRNSAVHPPCDVGLTITLFFALDPGVLLAPAEGLNLAGVRAIFHQEVTYRRGALHSQPVVIAIASQMVSVT